MRILKLRESRRLRRMKHNQINTSSSSLKPPSKIDFTEDSDDINDSIMNSEELLT